MCNFTALITDTNSYLYFHSGLDRFAEEQERDQAETASETQENETEPAGSEQKPVTFSLHQDTT